MIRDIIWKGMWRGQLAGGFWKHYTKKPLGGEGGGASAECLFSEGKKEIWPNTDWRGRGGGRGMVGSFPTLVFVTSSLSERGKTVIGTVKKKRKSSGISFLSEEELVLNGGGGKGEKEEMHGGFSSRR